MRIGIINIEPKIVNTAYMQIATYYRGRGDTVEWWSPLEHRQFDAVYCSSIFDFTDKSEIPSDVICGGTGYDLTSRLSKGMERCDYDYSIYPKCRTSYLWFSRGCIRKCPWCIVPGKEGGIRPVEIKGLNPRGEYVTVNDNNFFANPDWPEAIEKLKKIGRPVDIQQGVDARLLDRKKCHVLNNLKLYRKKGRKKRIKIAWDDPRFDMLPHFQRILRYIPAWKLMCYVLIGYDSSEEEDLGRVDVLRKSGIDPYVMPYDKNDLYQRAFARWVNDKAIYKSVGWADYRGRVEKQEIAGRGWSRTGGE